MIQETEAPKPLASAKPTVQLDAATVRFCGDSGDGMQLAGTQLTNTSALVGQRRGDISRLPGRDSRPARHEGRRERFSDPLRQPRDLHAGDQVDALVAMNPAALVTNLGRSGAAAAS